jgi:hypothetical protein
MTRLQDEARRSGLSVNNALGEFVAARPATRRDLVRAKRRLAQCAFIGFTESFEESLAALGRLLDWPDLALSLTAETRQRGAASTDLSNADRAAVAAVDDLDSELYAYARSLMRAGAPARRFSLADLVGRLLDRLPSPSRGIAQLAALPDLEDPIALLTGPEEVA